MQICHSKVKNAYESMLKLHLLKYSLSLLIRSICGGFMVCTKHIGLSYCNLCILGVIGSLCLEILLMILLALLSFSPNVYFFLKITLCLVLYDFSVSCIFSFSLKDCLLSFFTY